MEDCFTPFAMTAGFMDRAGAMGLVLLAVHEIVPLAAQFNGHKVFGQFLPGTLFSLLVAAR
jgi:hypothetical protein